MSVQSFEVNIPESTLDDLRHRLASTRPVPRDDATDWDAGTSPAYLRQLVDCWRSQFDWRGQEAHINGFAHHELPISSDSTPA